jgi:hypothetical protein
MPEIQFKNDFGFFKTKLPYIYAIIKNGNEF